VAGPSDGPTLIASQNLTEEPDNEVGEVSHAPKYHVLGIPARARSLALPDLPHWARSCRIEDVRSGHAAYGRSRRRSPATACPTRQPDPPKLSSTHRVTIGSASQEA
jgi:hypothetical protein